jgi:N-acetyl sugar amidotransferase
MASIGILADNTDYRICVRCVMDTTNPDIRFDAEGVCNFCHAYEEAAKTLLPAAAAESKLEAIVAEMKAAGRGKEYDCVLGVSGGVDSSYLAYKLKEFGLRVLAVQFDNGWNSELAVKNIELICKKLDIDLYTYVVDWEEFRDLQLAFLRASVANVEAPSDHGIFAALYRIAIERGIRYIVDGNNIVTEQISVRAYGWRYDDLRQLRAIHRQFGTKKLKTFPQMDFWTKLYYIKILGIRQVSLLNYMPYVKSEAMKILQDELGWRYYGGKHYESIITRFHQSYILINKFKMEKRRAHLSNLIFSGQMTRDEALEELKIPVCAPTMIEEDYEYVMKKLGLTEAEFSEILAAPPKSYRDYPNEERLYNLHESFTRSLHQARVTLFPKPVISR